MMKVIFINPPYLDHFSRSQRSPAVTKSGTLYFPMWLAYAAGYAEKNGHQVDVIDAPAQGLSKESVLQRVISCQPHVAVVDTSTPSIYNDIAFCESLKNLKSDIFVVMVGTHVSALPAESLGMSDMVDAVAIGEYDQTIVELADSMAAGTDVSSVAGVCYRNDAGIQITAQREYLTDLDSLPMVSSVYKRFLDITDYFNPNALFPMVTITTSRGCPHNCTFCVYPQTMMGKRLRLRSVSNVVDEVEYITENFPGVKSIFFEDDTFPAQKARCIEICQEILRRGLRISWTANARADLDKETMAIMKKAGCRCLCVGFESGSQVLLDNIKKRITVEKSRDFMKAAHQIGVLVHGCFIVGLPGETRQTMEQTLKLSLELEPDAVQFYPIMVYPGTEAYDWYERKGLISTRNFSNWLTASGQHNTVIRGEELSSQELVAFCDMARRKFYLRPKYLVSKFFQIFRHPTEARRIIKSARTFFVHLVRGTDISPQNSGMDKR